MLLKEKRKMWPSVVLLILCLKEKHFTTFYSTVSLSIESNCFIFLHRLVTVPERHWEQTVT